ncbi:LysE family translocator [Arthrobacter sp. JZ12]|uniref:LysE family translocator n=1 Tax=Arthrobacter sp. JZ12 TaxID=2654190 RepID=UPI002B479899|nr:LysE family translocator [Arthrobacter sp. JZ12]WRH24874.1 LysE family translocator [Arthrobacter sp. JZ12]
MSMSSYLAFCGLCVVLAVTPGPDSFLILRFSLRKVSSGMAASVGSALGYMVWAALVAVGLAALIEQSAMAYRGLKVLGGIYLVYLGIKAIRGDRKNGKKRASAPEVPVIDRARPWSSFGAGLTSTMLNPKVGLFFLAVVPQFLPKDGSVVGVTMFLGATLGTIVLVYLAGLCLVAAKANAWLNRPRVTRNLEISSGGILGVLGIGTAASAAQA